MVAGAIRGELDLSDETSMSLAGNYIAEADKP